MLALWQTHPEQTDDCGCPMFSVGSPDQGCLMLAVPCGTELRQGQPAEGVAGASHG